MTAKAFEVIAPLALANGIVTAKELAQFARQAHASNVVELVAALTSTAKAC